MDCGRACLHRGVDDSMGTFSGDCHVWSVAGVHGSKSCVVNAFLVFTSGGWTKKLFHRCGGARLRLRILLRVVNQLADVDEVCGISLAGGWTYLCNVQNAI